MSSKPTVHLFVDTNIFLSFYSFTEDDIEQLKKIVGLIKRGRLKLYLTRQVYQEFYRNREEKLAESLRQFERATVQKSIPRYMDGYAEADEYRKSVEAMVKARSALANRTRKDAEHKVLAADALFDTIREAAGLLHPSKKESDAAHWRMLVNNPPGKPNSFGDRLNWEVLLANVEPNTEVHIISKDGDFGSPLHDNLPRQFLSEEWGYTNGGELFLHAELKPFLNKHFPEIKLATDIEKREAIDRLKDSGSFTETHVATALLSPFADTLTDEEANELFQAAKENSQIRWIATDTDVQDLYRQIILPRLGRMDPALWNELNDIFRFDPAEPSDINELFK